MENCIFCRLINKEIPSFKVYEDEDVYAFLDLSQTTKGHTLLVPKTHVDDIFEYDEQLAAKTFAKLPKISKALEKALPEMKGLNLVNNNRPEAEQTVFHSHIHLIPRYGKQDTFGIQFSNHSDAYSADEMRNLADSIKKELDINEH